MDTSVSSAGSGQCGRGRDHQVKTCRPSRGLLPSSQQKRGVITVGGAPR
jgi:hypothetical protein